MLIYAVLVIDIDCVASEIPLELATPLSDMVGFLMVASSTPVYHNHCVTSERVIQPVRPLRGKLTFFVLIYSTPVY